MISNTYISPDTILANVLPLVDDERYEAMSKGFYISAIQKSLEDIAFDSFFDEQRKDFDFPVETLTMDMPPGCFNIKNIYVFNGEECHIGTAQKVWWKKNYYTQGNGYLANARKNNHGDPFYLAGGFAPNIEAIGGSAGHGRDIGHFNHGRQAKYYYNLQNGIIMFSSECRHFPRVHIHYAGTGTAINDIPIIPIDFRRYVEDYVTEFALRVRMAKEAQRWVGLWKIYDQRLNAEYNGSREKAILQVKSLSSSQREELVIYLGRNAW